MSGYTLIRPEMTAEEFRLLRDCVYDHCGILVREELKFVMERKLWARVEALGLRDFTAYYHYLRHDLRHREELESAIEALTTHETYFFREPNQLQAFSEELLPTLARENAGQRRLRIWSAGCSTGEEAYTIAMLIEDTGLFTGWDVEVYGTDISRRVLAHARQAEYAQSALRATPPDALLRHFTPVGQRYVVQPHARSRVSFGQLNLLDREMVQLVPAMDVVFCRNVLIYFDQVAKKRALAVFHEKLRPGGYLLLGHSESLIAFSSDFELIHLEKDLVYRRPKGGE